MEISKYAEKTPSSLYSLWLWEKSFLVGSFYSVYLNLMLKHKSAEQNLYTNIDTSRVFVELILNFFLFVNLD